MGNAKDLLAERKKAYAFLRREFYGLKWPTPIDSDKKLADALDVSLEDIVLLKEGRANPTKGLIKGVRDFFSAEVGKEEDIRAYLVDPFTDP